MELFLDYWYPVVRFLVVLTVLVFVHELGHYWIARRCGVRVEVFSIGFGPEIVGWTDKAETRWKISAVPLGGYVKMFGEGEMSGEGEMPRPLTPAERKVSFKYKTLGQRAAIVFGGPAANFIFAILVLGCLFAIKGQPFTPATFNKVIEGSAAEEAGLLPGDLIVRLGSTEIERFEEVQQIVRMNPEKTMQIAVLRDGKEVELTVKPKLFETSDSLGNLVRIGLLGVSRAAPAKIGEIVPGGAAEKAGMLANDRILAINGVATSDFSDVQKIVSVSPGKPLAILLNRAGEKVSLSVTPALREGKDHNCGVVKYGSLGVRSVRSEFRAVRKLDPLNAIWQSIEETWVIVVGTLQAVSEIIVGTRSSDELGGPIKIAQMSNAVWNIGFVETISFMALLSINLGLINLFPIPVLDGGHLLFFAFEGVLGRPLGEKIQEYSFRIGLVLILSLMVFVFANDILNICF